jgi:hypothetical protein
VQSFTYLRLLGKRRDRQGWQHRELHLEVAFLSGDLGAGLGASRVPPFLLVLVIVCFVVLLKLFNSAHV